MESWRYTQTVIQNTYGKEGEDPISNPDIFKKINHTRHNTEENLAKTVNMRGAKNETRSKPSELN